MRQGSRQLCGQLGSIAGRGPCGQWFAADLSFWKPADGTTPSDRVKEHSVAVAVSPARPSSRVRPVRRGLILALFVGSGAAGLVYQVVWSRELVLVFGNTTQAVATIVTAFMAGLGFGSLIGGRWANRSRQPLRLYGALELGVAVFAVLLPFVFDDLAEVYRGAYPGLVDNTLGLTAVRFALALAAVAPATFLMGATLPLLVRYLVRTLDEAGARLGELYAANTAGAVAGTVIAGFVLIEFLGLRLTSYVAVALNLLAGTGALVLSRLASGPLHSASPAGGEPGRDDLDATDIRASRSIEAPSLAADAGPDGQARQDGTASEDVRLAPRWAILLATFVSGFVSLALEVLWTRMLAEGTGSSIYIFTTILAIFLAGIAIGSAIYRRWSNPGRERAATLGVCLGVVGILAQATVVLGSGVVGTVPFVVRTVVVLLPATVLMGYAFPLTGRLVTPTARAAGGSVGLLYASNTAGSILGSFSAAFILAGTLGTNGSVLLLGGLNLLVGAALLTADPIWHARATAALARVGSLTGGHPASNAGNRGGAAALAATNGKVRGADAVTQRLPSRPASGAPESAPATDRTASASKSTIHPGAGDSETPVAAAQTTVGASESMAGARPASGVPASSGSGAARGAGGEAGGATLRRAARRGRLVAGAFAVLALLGVVASSLDLPLTRTATENHLRSLGLPVTHAEDELATVDTVGGPAAKRRLLIGGVGVTSLTVDTKLMGYLSKALRPRAKDFLVIAFGMGGTYRSGLKLGLRTDAVELSPTVPGRMPVFFPDASTYLHHPNGRVITSDGRNYVRLVRDKYDLVAVDPAPPIESAGSVVLYTREFLTEGKARLRPGGVFLLWMPYALPMDDLKAHVRTFHNVFPHVSLMLSPGGHGMFMLGSDAPLQFNDQDVLQVLGNPEAVRDLADSPDYPPTDGPGWVRAVHKAEWLSDDRVTAFTGPGPEITDDRPRSEYFLWRRAFMRDKAYVNEAMLRAATPR
jgi:predicted membrane-bound spermidine synthase